jgi:predicted N-acetyltransferase YhbS
MSTAEQKGGLDNERIFPSFAQTSIYSIPGDFNMGFKRISFSENDFIRVRDFLSRTYRDGSVNGNWFIDRWNFCRYFSQAMNHTFDIWPETVGLWEDGNGSILALVNSEGENHGEVFFQMEDIPFSDDMLAEMLDFSEKHLSVKEETGRFIYLRVGQGEQSLKRIMAGRGYSLLDWKETNLVLDLSPPFDYSLPEGFKIVDSSDVSDWHKGFAHGRAFGYYKESGPDNGDGEAAWTLLRQAPDYNKDLDLAVLDEKGFIASFACLWFDEKNKIGILEPVGTIPEYRRTGLGKAVIYEGIRRIQQYGARKLYVGSDQVFYKAIGFTPYSEKEIWKGEVR